MARIHQPSSTPRRQSSPNDSLFRGRTATETPARNSPSAASDKENRPAMNKGKQRAVSGSMAPPPRGGGLRDSNGSRGSKRRRIEPSPSPMEYQPLTQLMTQYQDVLSNETQDEKEYNPNQDLDHRRVVRLGLRTLDKELHDDRDRFLKESAKSIVKHIRIADQYMGNVRQTSDATIDSRYLLNVTELSSKKLASEAFGKGSRGVEADMFLAGCMDFMKNGGSLDDDDADNTFTTTQRRRRVVADDSDEEDATEGDGFDWDVAGELASFPVNGRPTFSKYLLGPLAVEKKVRNTQRTARQRKDPVTANKLPERIAAEDLERNEASNLTSLCASIRTRLNLVNTNGAQQASQEMEESVDLTDDKEKAILTKHHLSTNWEVSLFEFVINPDSFAQTVENLFYVSFLIKDGHVDLNFDDDGLPTIREIPDNQGGEERERGSGRHQAIFSLDHETWRTLITAFDIKQPLIHHRAEQSTPLAGAKGWYA